MNLTKPACTGNRSNSIRCKNIIVTGGAQGMGFHIAQTLLDAGAGAVLLVDVLSCRCQEAACKLNRRYGSVRAYSLKCDVTRHSDMEALFVLAKKKFQTIDMVVNNAGHSRSAGMQFKLRNTSSSIVLPCAEEAHIWKLSRRRKDRMAAECENGDISVKMDEEDIKPSKSGTVSFPHETKFSHIKNKQVRSQQYQKTKNEQRKAKKEAKKKREKQGLPRQQPHTIESLREKDKTVVHYLEAEENELVREDLENDEFSDYYKQSYEPKVLITYADNPMKKTRLFERELRRSIPNSVSLYSNRLSNVKITTELQQTHKDITAHRPGVILTVGRMLGALFHYDPEFQGARAVTFHNQRDYVFFRHYRYGFDAEGKKARLKELGPRFTLRLRSLQKGTFDSKYGQYEWIIDGKRHKMETIRRFKHLGADGGGRGGTIVNISSVAGLGPSHANPVFSASKHFTIGFSRSVGTEYFFKKTNVKVITLCPGVTQTEHHDRNVEGLPEFPDLGKELKRTLECSLQQSPEDVAMAFMQILDDGENGSVWIAEGKEVYKCVLPDRSTFIPPKKDSRKKTESPKQKSPEQDPCKKIESPKKESPQKDQVSKG
nr:unnamed protein product [Callosobruchus chinensis]